MDYKEEWKKFKPGNTLRDWETIGGAERGAWGREQLKRHIILLTIDLSTISYLVYRAWGHIGDMGNFIIGLLGIFIFIYFMGHILFIPDSPPGVDAGY